MSDRPPLCCDEPTFASPTRGEGRSRTLLGRRSQSLLPMSLEHIQHGSRDSVPSNGTTSSATALFRGWWATSLGQMIPTSSQGGALSVMSYNILAGCYVHSDKYPDCPPWALGDDYRAKNILAEVHGCDADIVTFQEISFSMFSNFIGKELERVGYHGNFEPITGAAGEACHISPSSGETKSDIEGLAIFFKTSRFKLVEMTPLKFNAIAARDVSIPERDKGKVMPKSHNIALIGVLECFVTESIVIAATTHASYTKPECQMYQARKLMMNLTSIKDMFSSSTKRVRTLLLGDFNAPPGSDSVEYFLGTRPRRVSALSYTGITKNKNTEEDSSCCCSSSTITFDSAYTEYLQSNPHDVTAVNPSQGGVGAVIDHIFFDELRCIAVCKLAKVETCSSIPNVCVPSDHFPVAAMFIP